MHRFSYVNRPEMLRKLTTEQFDVLVIGGGITGTGIALDAASRGLKTALVEKNDFAFGTSSRSTKLIHGGLRYLKQLEFGLVKEVGSERAIVHKLAPHLVIPERMLLPLSEKKGLGYWLTSIGLRIYDYLAGVSPEDQRKMLTKKQTLKYEPLLKADDIKGGAVYAEYRTDDSRLTIEIAKTAYQMGACCVNYIKVNDFVYDQQRVHGVVASDELTKKTFTIRSKAIVNAAGPWVDELREVNGSKQGKRLHHTKGVHIVVPHEKLPVRQAIYFDVEDGRMIFAIPRGRITYIGTTDTDYDDALDRVVATKADAEYLIRATNATFPSVHLSLNDIESSWAGLRPLIHEEGKSASQLSRKDEIFESSSGLISIAGGKLTGYRKMSERVVDLVIKRHFDKKALKRSYTSKIKLPGAFSSRKQVKRYALCIRRDLVNLGLPVHVTRYLIENYGSQSEPIMTFMQAMPGQDPPELKLLKAELKFTVENEMVMTLADFFVRRTGLLYFDISKVSRWMPQIGAYMKDLMEWDESRYQQEIAALDQLIEQTKYFLRNA